jgi:hypothetical protein
VQQRPCLQGRRRVVGQRGQQRGLGRRRGEQGVQLFQQGRQHEARCTHAVAGVVPQSFGLGVDVARQRGQAVQPGLSVVGRAQRVLGGQELRRAERQADHLVDDVGRAFLCQRGHQALVAISEARAFHAQAQRKAGGGQGGGGIRVQAGGWHAVQLRQRGGIAPALAPRGGQRAVGPAAAQRGPRARVQAQGGGLLRRFGQQLVEQGVERVAVGHGGVGRHGGLSMVLRGAGRQRGTGAQRGAGLQPTAA